jgi:Fic family protein
MDEIPSLSAQTWTWRGRFQVMMPALQDSPVGRVTMIRGHDPRFSEDYEVEAFLPDDLPDRVDLPNQTWMRLTEAMAELGRLDAAASLIPNPLLVTRMATRREAIGTSALEGTFAALPELLAAEVLPVAEKEAQLPPNVREVRNYARAADAAYSWIAERPITLSMLCALQAEIVKDADSDGTEAGAIRTRQVFIGARDRRLREARFIPPPPGDQLRAACERWATWLTATAPAASIQLIARIAMAHYQFETLHPFTDGNGRIGRLAAILQLIREGALRSPVLSVSPWLKDRAEAYRDHLLAVSQTGRWSPWIEFFATAVREESRSGHDRIMRLLALREDLGQQVRKALPRGRIAVEITDDLIAYPILTVADAHHRYGRTNQANRNAIAALVDQGILEPYGDTTYDRLYWNKRVFQIVDG